MNEGQEVMAECEVIREKKEGKRRRTTNVMKWALATLGRKVPATIEQKSWRLSGSGIVLNNHRAFLR